MSQYDRLYSGPLFCGLRLFEKDIIDTQANSAGTAAISPGLPPRHRIILRDSVILTVLFLSTLVLFAITSVLFRSFSARRVDLGKQFALSGQKALSEGAPEKAVRDLRLSLSYAPDERSNQLLLAEALAQAHHPDQARGYFLALLDQQAADGFLNLQLARLARQRKNRQAAIPYYRAAAVGNWSGDSIDERFHVQLELADYLAELGDLRSARAELLVAVADAPEDPAVSAMIGRRFELADDFPDALKYYKKALKLDPKNTAALDGAERVLEKIGEGSPSAGPPQ